MGPWVLIASSGLSPWSMAVDLGSVEKNPTALEGRGGHPRNFHTSSKNARGFLYSQKIKKLSALPWLGEALRRVPSYFDTIFIVFISVTTRVAKINEIKTKNSTLFFPAFQLLLKFVI